MSTDRVYLDGQLPKGFPTLDGHVTHPDHLPPGKRRLYLEALGDWMRENPDRATWPKWLVRFRESVDTARKIRAKRAAR